jgi:hypothetical protein
MLLRLKDYRLMAKKKENQKEARGVVRKCTAVEAFRLCPLVLLVKVGWRQGNTLGNEEVKVMLSGLLQCDAGGSNGALGLYFVFGRLRCDEIVMTVGWAA